MNAISTDPDSLRTRHLIFVLAAAGIILLAAVLRFHALGAQSLWNDEGNAYVQATRSFAEIADNAARDIHPPGYYWLLAVWRTITGDTEFALRSLSALASLLSAAFTYALGRRLYAPGAGLVAALLVAFNSFSIYYAQEARMYALLALWATAGMWVFVGFVRRPGWQWGAALAFVNTAGLWTQYGYAFVMLAQGVLALVWLASYAHRNGLVAAARPLSLYITANLFTILLYLPWLPTALTQITSWPSAGEPVGTAEALNVVMGWLFFGITYAFTNAGSFAIANFVLLFGLLPLRGSRQARWAMLVPVVWVLVTLAVFFGFQLFRQQNLKLLIPAQIAVALWLARGLWMLWGWTTQREGTRWNPSGSTRTLLFRLAAVAGGAWLVFNLAQAVTPLYEADAFQRADYRALVARIESRLDPDDAIILDAPNQAEVFRYYYRGAAPVYMLPEGLGGDDEATRAAVQNVINAHSEIFTVFWGETERDPNRVVETTLDAGAFEVGDTWYGDVRLARYVTAADLSASTEANALFGDHITLERYALNAETLAPGDVLQLALDWTTDAALDTRYKVFVQLLDEHGVLVAQRDSEPGGGLALTTTWTPGETIEDRHGLLIPEDLPPAHYLLITGLYDVNDPDARLLVEAGNDYIRLASIRLQEPDGA